ncbi:MAG TPA: HEPN domain-containing protein [bacterium]
MKDTKGKPSEKERALFAAAVVFTYGIWENYVEQLSIELAEKVSKDISPERVPEKIRKLLEKCTPWELTVFPGWRSLWVQKVRQQAIGENIENYGLNTAKAGPVKRLLELAGVGDAFEGLGSGIVPEHLTTTTKEPSCAIDRLVELRGEIVHTGKVPDTLRKPHVREWRQFIESISSAMDKTTRQQCATLL